MLALTDDVLQTILSAAQLLTGHKRRRFQAETTLQYCNGSARQAEKVFGWGRAAVDTGLHELRTGLRCLDASALRGRPCLSRRRRNETLRWVRAICRV